MKILPPDNEQKTAHLSEEKAEQYKSLRQSARRNALIATVLWVMALFMPANDIDNISGAGILFLLLLVFIVPAGMNATFFFPFVGQLCLFSLCIMRQSKLYNKPVFIGDVFIWIGAVVGMSVINLPIAMLFWLVSAFFVTCAGFLHWEAARLLNTAPPSDTVQAAAGNGDSETGTQNNEIQSSVQATAENNGSETVAGAPHHSDSPTHDNPPENRL